MVGSRTYLFWASSNSEASKESENSLFSLLGRIEEENDDSNRRIKLVYDTFQSIYNGKLSANDDDKFFILGLAPNSARIAVVYWNEMPLREFAGLILSLIHIYKEAAYCLPILAKVREAGVRAEIYPDASKMKKQMGYANDKQIPFVAIVGENEMNEGKLTLKNMTTGEQSLVTPDELLAVVKA